MALINKYPYSDFENLNLDWIISKVKEYTESVDVLAISFADLKRYVDNFIDQLDIQDAVNDKLDEMYRNGELYNLIAQFLTTESLLVFNTKSAMKAGQNLANGVPVMTLGTASYSDKKTTLYKVRQLTSSDVIDNDNIVALANYPTLIAQKLVQNSVGDNRYYLFIGDSYANRDNSWVDRLVSKLRLTSDQYTALRISGSGFLKDNYNLGTFQQNMENADITDKTKVTDIIVCGGANDRTYTQTEVDNAIGDFCTSAKTNYPNAQVYIGMIAWSIDPEQYPDLAKMRNAYMLCNKYDAVYLTGVEYALHRGTNQFEDAWHPNANGQAYLAKAIYQAYKAGSYSEDLMFLNQSFDTANRSAEVTSETLSGNMTIYQSGSEVTLSVDQRALISGTFNRNTWYKLGQFTNTPIFGKVYSSTNYIDIPAYSRNASTNNFEYVKLELQFYKSTSYSVPETQIRFRVLSSTASTVSEVYIGETKIKLNAMLQC